MLLIWISPDIVVIRQRRQTFTRRLNRVDDLYPHSMWVLIIVFIVPVNLSSRRFSSRWKTETQYNLQCTCIVTHFTDIPRNPTSSNHKNYTI